MDFLADLLDVVLSTLRDVLPIAAVLGGFQLLVLRRPLPNPRRLLLGCLYVFAGLVLFLIGLEQAILPVGKNMVAQLMAVEAGGGGSAGTQGQYAWVYAFAFAVGFSTAIAEPSLIAVAIKARELSAGAIDPWGLRVAVALGVALGVTLGSFRIVVGAPLHWFIMTGYVIVVVQTLFAPRRIVPLAYDSGGVSTSTVTVPLVAGLGLGLSESVPGRNPLLDGFGLIAFACLFPMITVMAYAQASEWLAARSAAARAAGAEEPAAPQEDPR